MISFHALGVRFTLPLLTLVTPILAAKLGLQGGVGVILLALSVHEGAHILAAKLAGVQITEIRLMPFGGSARMENPYGVPGRKIIPVAAAGPAANLLMALCLAALAQWGLLDPAKALHFARINLTLCMFNLLPALPLDGGRILYALLQHRIGENRALSLGVWLGRLLAGVLLLASVLGGLKFGRWNLSFMLAAVFLLASGADERTALLKSRIQRLSAPVEDRSPLPARFYQLDAGSSVQAALSLLRPREHAWFLLTRKGVPQGMIDDHAILEHIRKNGAADAALDRLNCYRFPMAAPAAPKL